VRVQSRRGERSIAADDIFLGYYETGVESDELVMDLVLPPLGDHRGTYRKITARSIDDWPLLGIAAVARFVAGAMTQVRVGIGALGDHAQRVPSVEALSGSDPTLDDIREAAEVAADGLDYHEGGMASPAYQRQIVATHLRRALEDVVLGTPERIGRQV
jgi:CO/xanthine dehydrogenase FAD-binding subunit